jgi:hypothetical protein
VSRDFTRIVDRAVWRTRVAAAAEAAAAGIAVAAWSVAGGLAVALIVAVWRSRIASRRTVIRELERTNPHLKNLLVTAEEMAGGALIVKPALADRVSADADRAVATVMLGKSSSTRRIASLMTLAALAWIVVSAIQLRRGTAVPSTAAARSPRQGVASTAPGAPQVMVAIQPPAYTKRPATTESNPAQVEAIENTRLLIDVVPQGGAVRVEVNGATRRVDPSAGGRFSFSEIVTKSGYITIADGGGTRTIAVTATPDALPSVRLAAPGRDLVFGEGNATIQFDAHATDDYGLTSLALRITKVSGSGERFEFTDDQIPLTVEKSNPREWTGRAARTLSALGLHDGDMVVYRAVAADELPGREASSETYFIEVSRLASAAGDAFTLPEQETRYALSQQMLIVKTERLKAARSGMTADAVAEASRNLAVEQRMIRSEFVFMLGGEIEDEEVEAEQSTELQAGRLANRGQRDLRAATIAMTEAERQLTDAAIDAALAAERRAVVALERAFARDRYILRALATQTGIDASRRLTGAPGRRAGWQRNPASARANRRAAQLEGLLAGLGEAAAAVRGESDVRVQLGVLAATAVRIDAESTPLRRIATDLQQLIDRWPTRNAASRAADVDAIVDAVARETRQSVADPPISWSRP